MTKNFVEARDAFINQINFAIGNKCDRFVLDFYLGVLVYLLGLEKDNKTEITLPTTVKLPELHQNNVYQIKDLITFFDTEIDQIVAAFNKRNGNDYFSYFKPTTLKLLKNSRKVPLSK